ncbi:MAG TPA: hypothetical protein VF226_17855 [Hyphomicrobiaceae bacterium]
MTQRDRQKKRRTAAPRASSRGARTSTPAASKSRASEVEQLLRERDELRTRLDVAEARIKLLESQRLEVLNRIDWVIDSIHNVIERQN